MQVNSGEKIRDDMTSREPSIGNSDNTDPTTQTLGKVRAADMIPKP